ncbi:helix-turn-helix transcriptional regulator [Streptomyces sp. NPDC058486]|uniref:helix-turn-helix domain-containing protein n=1 Tax=unclassified Streptomyces TaxID=2593676 RepID=UPI003653B2C9
MLRHCRLCTPEQEHRDGTKTEETGETEEGHVNPVIDAFQHIDTLTEREREVLAAMPAGESNADMAVTLGITERTVKFHVTNLREKLGGLSRIQLHLLALLTEAVRPRRPQG